LKPAQAPRRAHSTDPSRISYPLCLQQNV
jgi:hypothetical protein